MQYILVMTQHRNAHTVTTRLKIDAAKKRLRLYVAQAASLNAFDPTCSDDAEKLKAAFEKVAAWDGKAQLALRIGSATIGAVRATREDRVF